MLKHLGQPRAVLADLCFVTGYLTWRVRSALRREPDDTPERLLPDFLRHSVLARGFEA